MTWTQNPRDRRDARLMLATGPLLVLAGVALIGMT